MKNLDFFKKDTKIQVMFSELDIEITRDEILKSIKQLINAKSGGPDQLLNEFILHGQHVFLPYLHTLFNKLLNTGYFPSSWAEGYIVPLHEKVILTMSIITEVLLY